MSHHFETTHRPDPRRFEALPAPASIDNRYAPAVVVLAQGFEIAEFRDGPTEAEQSVEYHTELVCRARILPSAWVECVGIAEAWLPGTERVSFSPQAVARVEWMP